eukprot:977313-Heterocapsa_arctica.AAC.1
MAMARQKRASEPGVEPSASRRKLSGEELTHRVVRAVSRDPRCVADRRGTTSTLEKSYQCR